MIFISGIYEVRLEPFYSKENLTNGAWMLLDDAEIDDIQSNEIYIKTKDGNKIRFQYSGKVVIT